MNLSKEKTVSFDAHFTAEEIERILINAIDEVLASGGRAATTDEI